MQNIPASALPGVTRGAGTARNNISTGITQERQKNTGHNSGQIPIKECEKPDNCIVAVHGQGGVV